MKIFQTQNNNYQNDNNNKRIRFIRKNIIHACNEQQVNLWDFHNIMGGENSMKEWYKMGLTGEDKLHFKKLGYEIQGELIAKAFIDLILRKNEIR